MRAYLELRLNYPFTKTLTSELTLAFDKATFSLADETRLTAFENIISVFVRTDFIRFSKAENAAFAPQEKQTLINTLIESINTVEQRDNDSQGATLPPQAPSSPRRLWCCKS